MTPFEAALAEVPGLEHLDRRTLRLVAQFAEVVDAPAGAALIDADDRRTAGLLVARGEVAFETAGWNARVGEGARFLVDNRHATPPTVASACAPSRVLLIDRRAGVLLDALRAPVLSRRR